MTGSPSKSEIDDFVAAVDAGDGDPTDLAELGQRLLAASAADQELSTRVRIGLAALAGAVQDYDAAIDLFTAALEHAPAGELSVRVRTGLAIQLALSGDLDGAANNLRNALSEVGGPARARVLVNLGNVLDLVGDHIDAGQCFEEALEIARSFPDLRGVEVAAANGAGLIALHEGDLTMAEVRFRHALLRSGDAASAAAEINLGTCLARQGFIANAIVHANHAVARTEFVSAEILTDAAGIFLAAHVPGKAAAVMKEAMKKAEVEGSTALLASAHAQFAARVALTAGNQKTAQGIVSTVLIPQSHSALSALAEALDEQATPNPPRYPGAREALITRAHSTTNPDTANSILFALTQSSSADSADEIVRSWAEGTLAANSGRLFDAEHHLNEGLRQLDAYLETIGSLEIRARVRHSLVPLDALATRLASDLRQPGFLGRHRIRADRLLRQRPQFQTSPELLDQLNELRRADQSTDPWQTAALTDRIRQISWGASSATEKTIIKPVEPGPGDLFFAQTTTHIVGQHHHTGLPIELIPIEHFEYQVRKIQLAISTLSRTFPKPTARNFAAVKNAATELDEALLQPLALLPKIELDIHPSPIMGELPWRLLPSLSNRPVRIGAAAPPVPHRPIHPSTPILLCVGPNLESDDHAHDIAALYNNATLLAGADATVRTIVNEMANHDVVHLIAHGSTDPNDTLFSHLKFHDGPLTLYDIDTAVAVPETVLMSSCEIGAATSQQFAGYGLASVFAAKQTRRIIAAPTIISERHTANLVLQLHRRLLQGQAPEHALINLDTPSALATLTAQALQTVT